MSAPAHQRPQLTTDELHQLKWLLGGILTLIGLGTVLYMDIEAWTLMGLTGLVTVATMLNPTLPARVPGLVHTLTFPIIVVFFALDVWLKAELLPAMVRLDILLLLYRNLTYRQRRDDLQIVVLGLFLVIVAGVLTVSLTFAAQILVYTACALALLLVVTLTDSAAGGLPRAPIPPGEMPPWARHVDWPQLFRRLRQATDWRVAGLGAVLFAGVVGVSALLFLAIPRFQFENSMFLDRFISKKAKSGFSDSIRFGDVTEIQQDNSVALSVDVSDESQIPAAPYWRMLVLDRYDNGTFRMSSGVRMQEYVAERAETKIAGYARPRRGEPVYWTFYLESGVSRHLPLLGHFDTLLFREVQNYTVAPRLALVALRDEPVTMTAYRVEGFEVGATLADPPFAERWRKSVLAEQGDKEPQARLSLSDPDLLALGRVLAEATGGERLPASEFARRVSGWLKRNHVYSLSPVIPGGAGDPLVRWLRSREGGHCELFAGSFVVLARAAGFPARVITGFRGGTWNGYSHNFTIRNADAHAWAEIFDEASGAWLRADPLAIETANAAEEVRGEAAMASRLDRSWKARFDSLRVFWYRRIVSFDQRSQIETVLAVKEAAQSSGRRLREIAEQALATAKAWLGGQWDGRRILVVLASLAVAIVPIWVWREYGRAWWRGRRGGRGARNEDPVRREAARWLARMAGSGAQTDEGRRVTTELQRLRFGARATWPEPEKVFRRARRTIRDDRRRGRVTRS